MTSQLVAKHERMRKDLFTFFRGTFYRWAQVWPELAREERGAPRVMAVGDLHVDSFGTWRDVEGRLAWGVDDFDDAYPLPYTNDLVRLATSVKIMIDCGVVSLTLGEGCDAILNGYRSTLQGGGHPIVLAETEEHLEKLGVRAIKPPEHFWRDLNTLPVARGAVPRGARRAIDATLPGPPAKAKIVRREAGTGSLGHPRYVLIAEWAGSCVAREAKALVPSSCVWAAGGTGGGEERPGRYYEGIMRRAIRAHDPYQVVVGRWLVRRLSPDSNPIEIEREHAARDEAMLLHAMGTETANVHLGSQRQRIAVLADLRARKRQWLKTAAKTMAKAVERDWKDYRS